MSWLPEIACHEMQTAEAAVLRRKYYKGFILSNSWFTRWNPLATAIHKGTQKRQKSQASVSSLELLEERVVPAAYLITGTADGAGTVSPSNTPGIDFEATTLRGAILAANASVGVADTIELPGGT